MRGQIKKLVSLRARPPRLSAHPSFVTLPEEPHIDLADLVECISLESNTDVRKRGARQSGVPSAS